MSWKYMLLNVFCASIFTSYAFKIESVELAMINIIGKYLFYFGLSFLIMIF